MAHLSADDNEKITIRQMHAIAVTEEQTIHVMHVQFDGIREVASVSKTIFFNFLFFYLEST